MNQHYVGIIGFGTEGAWHAHQVDVSEVFELVGVSDISEARKLVAQEKGIKFYNSNKQLLADPKIDIVIIATPNNSHNELSIEAMEAGKHVICEKPVAGNCAELREMIEVSEKTGRVLSVYQNRRWDGDYLTVKKIMKSGRIGEVSRIESRIHGSRGIPKTWMREGRYEGGVLWDWGAHVLDQILALKPGKRVLYVSATMSHMTTNADVEDGFTAMLIFEDGTEALVEVSTNNLIPLPRWYLTGKKGSAMIKDWRSGAELATLVNEETEEVVATRVATGITKMMVPRRPEEIHKSAFPVTDSTVYDYYRNFSDVIDGMGEPAVKLTETMRVLHLMEAVKEAAQTHETIWFEHES